MGRRDLRLISGLVLFTYVTLHLACHALGLVSLDTAEAALRLTLFVWHSVPGTVLLYGAAAIHIGLALHAVYERRTLRMAPLQALRIVLGLVMPIALIGHFVGTRYAYERFGLPPEYARIAANIWSAGGQGLAFGLLAPGWIHGCLGLRYAFGTRRTWQRLRPLLFAVSLLLPTLAALGFVTMGRELVTQEARAEKPPRALPPAQAVALGDMRDAALDAWFGLIAFVALLRIVRTVDERRRKAVVRIAYPDRRVVVPKGWTVLEASRSHGIPHSSVCGGRARCTTCRVRVVEGLELCPDPHGDEARTLARIEAPADVRLACQLRPLGDVAVEPLLTAEAASPWRREPPRRSTLERELALLFFEVRLERNGLSAHDAIYALDRLDALVGRTLDRAGGTRVRRDGDSVLAVFGLEQDLAAASRAAIDAAQAIETRAGALLERLHEQLGLRAHVTVGVHVGRVVVGTIGTGEARMLSALGPAVDAIEGLRGQARAAGTIGIVSEAAAAAAGFELDRFGAIDAAGDASTPAPAREGALGWAALPSSRARSTA